MWKEGERVEGKYKRYWWSPATVTRVHRKDRTYDLRYDGGEEELHVGAALTRTLEDGPLSPRPPVWREGDRVMVKVDNTKRQVKAGVVKLVGGDGRCEVGLVGEDRVVEVALSSMRHPSIDQAHLFAPTAEEEEEDKASHAPLSGRKRKRRVPESEGEEEEDILGSANKRVAGLMLTSPPVARGVESEEEEEESHDDDSSYHPDAEEEDGLEGRSVPLKEAKRTGGGNSRNLRGRSTTIRRLHSRGSEESSDDDDEEPTTEKKSPQKRKRTPNGRGRRKRVEESEEDSDEGPIKKRTSPRVRARRKRHVEESEEDSDEGPIKKRTSPRVRARRKRHVEESEEEAISSDEEPKKKRTPSRGRVRRKRVEESDEDSDEGPIKKRTSPRVRSRKRHVEESEEEAISSDEEPKKKRTPRRARRKRVEDSEEEAISSDEEPKKKRTPRRARRKRVEDSEEEAISSDEEPKKKRTPRRARRKRVEESEEEAISSDEELKKKRTPGRGRRKRVEESEEDSDEGPIKKRTSPRVRVRKRHVEESEEEAISSDEEPKKKRTPGRGRRKRVEDSEEEEITSEDEDVATGRKLKPQEQIEAPPLTDKETAELIQRAANLIEKVKDLNPGLFLSRGSDEGSEDDDDDDDGGFDVRGELQKLNEAEKQFENILPFGAADYSSDEEEEEEGSAHEGGRGKEEQEKEPPPCTIKSVFFIHLLETLIDVAKVRDHLVEPHLRDEYVTYCEGMEELLGEDVGSVLLENAKANRSHVNKVMNDAIMVGRFLVERRQYGQSALRDQFEALRLDENRNKLIMESVCRGELKTVPLTRNDYRNIDLSYSNYQDSDVKTLSKLKQMREEDMEMANDNARVIANVICGACQKWPRHLRRQLAFTDEDEEQIKILVCGTCGNALSSGNDLVQFLRCFSEFVPPEDLPQDTYSKILQLSAALFVYFKRLYSEFSWCEETNNSDGGVYYDELITDIRLEHKRLMDKHVGKVDDSDEDEGERPPPTPPATFVVLDENGNELAPDGRLYQALVKKPVVIEIPEDDDK